MYFTYSCNRRLPTGIDKDNVKERDICSLAYLLSIDSTVIAHLSEYTKLSLCQVLNAGISPLS